MKLDDPLAKWLHQAVYDRNLNDVSVMAGGREYRLDRFTIEDHPDGPTMNTQWFPLDTITGGCNWRVRLRLRLARLRWLKAAI